MLSQLEQACNTNSTESSSGPIEFDNNWQRIFVTALTLLLDEAIPGRRIQTSLVDRRIRISLVEASVPIRVDLHVTHL